MAGMGGFEAWKVVARVGETKFETFMDLASAPLVLNGVLNADSTKVQARMGQLVTYDSASSKWNIVLNARVKSVNGTKAVLSNTDGLTAGQTVKFVLADGSLVSATITSIELGYVDVFSGNADPSRTKNEVTFSAAVPANAKYITLLSALPTTRIDGIVTEDSESTNAAIGIDVPGARKTSVLGADLPKTLLDTWGLKVYQSTVLFKSY